MPTLYLESEADWTGFRQAAREHLRRSTPPDALFWRVRGGESGLFDDEVEDVASNAGPVAITAPADNGAAPSPAHRDDRAAPAHAPPTVSRAFLSMAESVVLHADPLRFDLVYQLLWRMQRESGLRHDPLDAQILQAQGMARAVHRDMHKMKAFVRFRPIQRRDADPLHVAWFEPEHHIVAATAPFFRDRFTAMQWAILTPRQSVRWDGQTLTFGPGALREDAPPADAGESLWLTYYTHIFNPARLKMNMMRKEMPRKYWHNLPEAKLISQLANESNARTAQMVHAEPTVPARRIVPLVQTERFVTGTYGRSEDGQGRFTECKDAQGILTQHDDTQEMPARYEDIQRAVQSCRDCAIGQHATQAIWGEGPARARLMVVGEQPGDQEDLRGRPFVGPAGKLFDRALGELGWSRSELYVTNAVKHFKFEPRGKKRIHKTPSQQEAAACGKWLDVELAQVQPEAIIALGATAARALLGRAVAVTQFRGQWVDSPTGIPVLVTLHPSALLRMEPALQADAWKAWLRDLSQAESLILPA